MSKSYLRKKFHDNLVKKKIVKVQQVLAKNHYPPVFEPEKWEKNRKYYSGYMYVLDVPIKDKLRHIWYPGVFSKRCREGDIYSSSSLVEYMKSDLDFLGFTYRDDDGTLNYGEWRIAIYYIPTLHDLPIGFHFVRQDKDGRWSEKPSWRRRVRIIYGKSDTPPELIKYDAHLAKTLVVKKK